MPNIVANRLNQQLDLQASSHTVSAEEASGTVALEIAARSLRVHEIDAAIVGAVDLSCEAVQRAAGIAVLPANRHAPGDAAVVLVLKRLADARRDGDPVLSILGPPSRRDPPVAHSAGTALLRLGGEDAGLSPVLGHAHAASGLVHVAAAVVACDRRMTLPVPGRAAMPWLPLSGDRSIAVEVEALGGATTRTVLRTDSKTRPRPGTASSVRLAVFGGRDIDDLMEALAKREPLGATEGANDACRIAVVAADDGGLATRIARACTLVRSSTAAAEIAAETRAGATGVASIELEEGIYFGAGSLSGDLAFVFTGPAGAYPHMGRDLALALPELVDALGARMRTLRDAAGWVYDEAPSFQATPTQKLWGSSYLIQLHAELTRGLLGMQPQASIGYCSGETNALFALSAWSDLDGFRKAIDDSGVYSRELCGELLRVRKAWKLEAGEPVDWAAVRVRAPVEDVRIAIGSEPRVHLTIINSPNDVIIGGDRAGCERVAARLGKHRAAAIGYDFVMHCPEAREYATEWRAIHHRPTRAVPGVRFYTNATTSSYAPTDDAVADALTGQAMNPVDFPALIRRAWDDGVRVFVEHGPHAGCTKWIAEALGDRPHLAVALDRYGRSSLVQAVEGIARLVAAGVPMNHRLLAERLSGNSPRATDAGSSSRRAHRMVLSAHLPPIRFGAPSQEAPDRGPPTQDRTSTNDRAPQEQGGYVMAPAPSLPAIRREPGLASAARPMEPSPDRGDGARSAETDPRVLLHTKLGELHTAFLRQQTEAQTQFMRWMLGSAAPAMPSPESVAGDPAAAPRTAPAHLSVAAPPVARVDGPVAARESTDGAGPTKERAPAASPPSRPPVGPSFDRSELEVLASGVISSVFGDLFRQQDGHARQVRMPEPPLLLADRVLGIDAVRGSMGLGTVWTQTDVAPDAFYLHEGRMPAGILVESGQADLLLISWLGVDFHNRGERVYRLLGCDLTSHGELPRPGDTLTYDIHVDGHAQQGDVRLFFFHYDCRVDGALRVSVRNGQAGFFTTEELAASAGVLWNAETAKPSAEPRLDPPAALCTKRSFTDGDIAAFIAGHTRACFGPGFERAQTHPRSPAIQGGRKRLLDEVTHFDREGGPWRRGYLRARLAITPESWFFAGHFKNDPCMPGTLMFEGCLQAMSVYLAALGYTLDRDGFRFEPVPLHTYPLRCRGQALPTSREVVYEVFVDEVWGGPHPTLFADLLGTVDGLPAFHCRRMGLRLVPAWPLDEGRLALDTPAERRPIANAGAFEFDHRSLLACALGRPSEAFGAMYRPFDGTRRVARLPGPPYHFMSRVARVLGPIGGMEIGSVADVDYDVPPDAWYFADNGARVMPYAVLLEVELQPCGWLASYIGSALTSETDLVFRNLDGKGTVHHEVPADVGTLTTTTTLKSLSTSGGLIILGFDVVVRSGDTVVYDFETVFGFFSLETMRHQVGLKVAPEDRARLTDPSDTAIDLAAGPRRYFDGSLRLATGKLLMIDRVTGFWPKGGKAGLGRVRAEKDISADEWFFKAHFFQDPVQPGSLGLEALLQALQFAMIEADLGRGVASPRFEAVALDVPMTWKYRGQVVPENLRVVADLEITRTGEDARGPFAIADGSLWVDGKRIYQASGLGMRIVGGEAGGAHVHARPAIPETPCAPVTSGLDSARSKGFWLRVTRMDQGWAGEDVLFALLDRFVSHVHLPARASPFHAGRGALFVANHQVAVETVLAAVVVGAMTGSVATLPAKAEHRNTWVGELMRHLTSRPGLHDPALMRFIDREDPESVLLLRRDLLGELRGGRSALVHVEGTRATTCRHRVSAMSAVFLDLAIEAEVDVVPTRFTGGLPVGAGARLEFPVGYGRQHYWFGEPIAAKELRALPLVERKHRVRSAINALGTPPEAETPAPPAPEFAARVGARRAATDLGEPEAVLFTALAELHDPSAEGRALLAEATDTNARGDGDLGAWRSRFAAWLGGHRGG